MRIKLEKEAIEEAVDCVVARYRRNPTIFFQTKNNDTIENYLKCYSNKYGYHLTTLDESTMEYIDEVADLYRKLNNNDHCIIHIKMSDRIDYYTLKYELALEKLCRIIFSPEYKIQIIIDVKLTRHPNALNDTGNELENIYKITSPVNIAVPLIHHGIVFEIV